MNEIIRAPKLTKEMEPAIVSCVYVGVGDYVEAGSVLLDIETEKVALEVCAPVGGTVLEFNFNSRASLKSEQILLSIVPGQAPASPRVAEVQEPHKAQEASASKSVSGYMRLAVVVVVVLSLAVVVKWF